MKKKNTTAFVVMVTALICAVFAGGCDIFNPVIDEWWVGPEGGGGRTSLNTPITFYTITFKSNGGDYIDLVHNDLNLLTDPPEQRIQAGQRVKEPGLVENTTPPGSEYIKGWYIDDDGDGILEPNETTEWKFKTMIPDKNMTLMPRWEGSANGYTIDFDLNENFPDATGITNSDTTYNGIPRVEHVVAGNVLSEPKWFGLESAKANDYVFYGWYTDPNCAAGTLWDFNTLREVQESDDLADGNDNNQFTLYAGWGKRTGNTVTPPGGGASTPVYTVEFETGVQDNPIPPQSVYGGRVIPEPDAIHNRDGYVFSGWYKDSRFNTPYDFDTPVTGNMKLYAKWEPVPYTFPWFTTKFYTTNDYGMPDDWYPFQCDTGDVNWVDDGSGDPDGTANFNNQMSVVDLLKDNPNAMALIVGFKDDPSDPGADPNITEAEREESARGEFDDMGVSGQLFKYTDYNLPAGELPAGDVPGTTGTSTDEVRIYVFTPKNQS